VPCLGGLAHRLGPHGGNRAAGSAASWSAPSRRTWPGEPHARCASSTRGR